MTIEPTITEQFEAFHELNPRVYQELVLLARRATARGRTKLGMKQLFEVLRWNRMMATDDPSADFKLNNNYTSHYARLIMEREPDLEGVFDIRCLRAP